MTEALPTPFAAAWNENHRLLLDVAYRMLGSVNDAEDVVQEAFARLLRADADEIDDVRAWLVVVVSRLCVDFLRSARVRREQTVGPWLPEPLVDAPAADPADRVTLDESVRMALLIVLEQLTPAERAAFVLHDIFQFPFETVATIVGRSPAACRQLASRARRHVSDNVPPSRFVVDDALHRRVAERFIEACASGDLDALMEVLAVDVEGTADLGELGRALGAQAARGRDEVAARLFALFGPHSGSQLIGRIVNGEPGVVVLRNGRPFAVMSLTIDADGRVGEIHSVADPVKLTRVRVT
jgi:RNA polymerase sigma-70 factor (ECF subfamily)